MRDFILLPWLVLLSVFATAGSLSSQHSHLEGRWAGGVGDAFGTPARWQRAQLRLHVEGNQISGFLRNRSGDQRLAGTTDGKTLTFSVDDRGHETVYEGTLNDGVLEGRTEGSPFVFVQEAPLSPEELERCEGVFEVEPGHLIFVEDIGRLLLTDFKSGIQRFLGHRENLNFFFGPARLVPFPFEGEIQFQRSLVGEVDSFEFTLGDETISARRVATPVEEPFSFRSFDGTRLEGTLHLPSSDGTFPAAVWVHGSGKQSRSGAGTWKSFLLAHGMAVLAVDKRGVGSSGGRYELPGGGRDNVPHMERRSKDVVAAYDALCAHPRVDADVTGFVGISQAGWVIPQAASLRDTAFAVILSGGATHLEFEGRFSLLTNESNADETSMDVETALRRTRKVVPTSQGFRHYFEALECPSLWIYGMKDRSNPSALCIELIVDVQSKLAKDFTIQSHPNANHSLLDARIGGAAENDRLSRFAPGLFTQWRDWLLEIGVIGDDA